MLDTVNLSDHFLISLDTEELSPFHRSVVYVCEHSEQGAMGLMINQQSGLDLNDVFSSMDIVVNADAVSSAQVLTGGPVQENAGFVLHGGKNKWESSLALANNLFVTTSQDILQAIADKEGPEKSLIMLGYSGWEAGQLEDEIGKNYWLSCPAKANIVFNTPIGQRWNAAIHSLGFTPCQLSREIGHV